jgi:hypothetical protein
MSADCSIVEVTVNDQLSSQSEAVLFLCRSIVGSLITASVAVYPLHFYLE